MAAADLVALLDTIFADGGSMRDLLLAIANAPVQRISGSVFREALERHRLRAAFDTVAQDPQLLEQLDEIWIDDDGSCIELHLAQPLMLRQRTAIGSVRLQVNRVLAFDVDRNGTITLRAGDIKLYWLRLKEDLLVQLKQEVDAAGIARDMLSISAGHIVNQHMPLDVITLPPSRPAPTLPAPAPPPVPAAAPASPTSAPPAVVIVLHQTPGRLRLKVAWLYRNPAGKQALEQGLVAHAGIRQVTANPLTGNVVVHFEVSLTLEQIRDRVGRIAAGQAIALPAEAGAPPWHLCDPQDLAGRLATHPDSGLSPQAAGERLAAQGPNLLPQAPTRSAVAILLAQFQSLPVALLSVSALASLFSGGLLDGLVIMGVVMLNAGIGYATESWAEQTVAGLNCGPPIQALAIRAGRTFELAAADLVPGDLIALARGMAVPADARLLSSEHLSIDESALTGESAPVAKWPATMDDAAAPLGSRWNMLYRGTVVTGGSGRALVVATGAHSEAARIQRLLAEAQQPETPLQRQLRSLSGQLVFISLGLCGLVFGIGLLRGRSALQMLKVATALAIAAVPEGLPTVATTTLAIGLRRLEGQNILVRRLLAVETLGAVQFVCLDKTGTITRNQMQLLAMAAGGHRYHRNPNEPAAAAMLPAGSAGGSPAFVDSDQPEVNIINQEAREMLRLAALCSEVEISGTADAPEFKGSPTETALVQAAWEIGIDLFALRDQHPLQRSRLRGEGRGFMDTLHRDGARQLLAVKGSPDEVLALCNRSRRGNAVLPLDEAQHSAISAENQRLAGQALRMLGVAYLPASSQPEIERNLIWLGLLGIADPPRPGVDQLIAQLRGAGVRIVMITGDQSATASASAQQIGLKHDGRLESLDAAALAELPPDMLRSLARRVDIFSRVSPADKLRIVQALQHSGQVVAMTGDGINDGPALRAADIGITMGRQGSPVAREVADMVVRDDDLATIITAIAEGRTIADDIKKAVHFILGSNASEILITLAAGSLGLGEPLSPLQLLWLNLVTDVFPELALGLEPPESDVLQRPPRDPQAAMFSRRDVQRISLEGLSLSASGLTAYGWGLSRYGQGAQAGSMAFATLTMAQLLYALSCRSEQHWIFDGSPRRPNPYVPLFIGGSIAVQGVASLAPGPRRLLGVSPLAPTDWLLAAVLSLGPFLAGELLKMLSALEPDRKKDRGSHTSATRDLP